MFAPMYTKKNGKDEFVGMAHFCHNENGEPEMIGFQPSRDIPQRLKECVPILENAMRKYPFLRFKINDDVEAIEVWHKKYPELLYAIGTMMVEDDSNLTILDEKIPKVKGFALQYWDQVDSDRDKILGRMIQPYDAATGAVWEVLAVDFKNADFK